MYVSISMKSYLIWKKTLKLTQIKIRAAKIKVVGPIDVEYSIFKKVLGTSAEVFSFQFMPIRTIFGWFELLIQVPNDLDISKFEPQKTFWKSEFSDFLFVGFRVML